MPVETCEREYAASKLITNDLSDLIFRQVLDIHQFDSHNQAQIIKYVKRNKETQLRNAFQEVVNLIENPTE